MLKMNVTGFLFLLLICLISISSALDTLGTTFEQLLGFFAQVVTFFIVIALYGKWQGVSLFNSKIVKVIALSYPALVIITPLYQAFEYSEQRMPTDYIYLQSLEFLFALLIAFVLVKDEK
ncbi:hypothetical protein [uncultured Vibrio sp.]|uniref:hypothetical protein n=1 Tax=uncultured Vibrio sp. TaxID=114054 RepID=UPI00261B7BC3|nr:hypothetical protein [uncultured Vibrio sp.]